jgi:hypothetical protein
VELSRCSALCVGATFHEGARFGSGFTVPKMRAMASTGRKDAYRPHMGVMIAAWIEGSKVGVSRSLRRLQRADSANQIGKAAAAWAHAGPGRESTGAGLPPPSPQCSQENHGREQDRLGSPRRAPRKPLLLRGSRIVTAKTPKATGRLDSAT